MARFLPLILVLASACVPVLAEEDVDGESWHGWHHASQFAWQVQVNQPAKGLGQDLDNKMGLGLGAQWTRFRSNGFANRFRFEWNVLPKGNPVGPLALESDASNYVASFDRLWHVSGESRGFYVLGGLGAVRWFMTQGPAGGPRASWHATKLAVTGGAGYRFNDHFSAEARYLVSSFNGNFDGNLVQGSLGMRF